MAASDDRYRVAIVQSPPVILDREATLAKAVAKIDECADGGAKLVAFPEVWVAGYPDWVWRFRPGYDGETNRAIWARFLAESIDLERDDLRVVRDAAEVVPWKILRPRATKNTSRGPTAVRTRRRCAAPATRIPKP